MKRLAIDLPDETHKQFKAHCALQGIDMAELVRSLIDGELQKAGKVEKKKSK